MEPLQQNLSVAKDVLIARGARPGAARVGVLSVLIQSRRPLKAYVVLDHIRQWMPGAGPAIVYRALDFLQEEGLALKLNSVTAFLYLPTYADKKCVYLVCERCSRVEWISVSTLPTKWMHSFDSSLYRSVHFWRCRASALRASTQRPRMLPTSPKFHAANACPP
ncbi:transcriptional repressor [Stenotrophomonas sp. S39]|nr:transcriptional repressor [Stenotrophomonas sp. S39]